MYDGLNYNYYGIPSGGQFVNQNSDVIGDFVSMNIWGYYYDNATNWGKPLDSSVYLWCLHPSAAYATNAAFSIATGNTLNIDIAYNQCENPVPLAMAASDVSGVDADYYKGFYPDPVNRLAYDDSRAGGYAHTALFYNIVYNGFCAVPRAAIYRADGSDNFLAATPDTIATIINASPSTRFVSYFRYDLYSGTSTNRVISEYYNESTYRTIAMPDILSDRPIPDSCTIVKDAVSDSSATPPHEPAWADNKVYSPFAAALCRDWSMAYTESADNQYRVGFTQQYTPSYLRNGRGAYNGGRVTGQFFKYNPTEQNFSDVSYKWETVIYDPTDKVFLQPGYDITSLSHNLRFMTRLKITDMKDAESIGEATARAVKHEMAFMGFYFADNIALGQTGVLGSSGNGNGIYLPEIIDGVTTGNYFTGDQIKDIPYCDNTNVSDFQYTGEFIPQDGETGDFNSLTNSGTIGSGVSYYALKTAQANALCTWLNTTYLPTDQDEFIQDFKGENPSDYITAMMFYPFDIPLAAGTDEQIVVGKLNAGSATGRRLNYTYGTEYNYGSYTFPRFGDFRDMLMKISVFIPFCGKCDLDPRLWAGRTMTVKMSIDFPTGACTAKLYRLSEDGTNFVLETISGTVGVPLPLSSVQNGSYQVSITNLLAAHKTAHRQQVLSTLGVAGGAIGAIGGAMSGNLAVMAGSLIGMTSGAVTAGGAAEKMENIDYNIDHTAPTVAEIQGGSPFLNCGQDHRVSIFICVPKFLPGYNAASYGKTTGYATCKQGVLSSISKGFTRCSSANLSGIAATSTEKQMIFNLLQGGVIV